VAKTVDVSIISSGANIADARLHRVTNALVNNGLCVELFAPGKIEDAPDSSPFLAVHTPSSSALGRLLGGKNFAARYLRSRVYLTQASGRVIYAISPESFALSYLTIHVKNLFRPKSRKQLFAVDLYEDYLQLIKDRAWAKRYFGLLGAIGKFVTVAALWAAKRADLTTVADKQVPPFDAQNRLVVRNLPDINTLTLSGERSSQPRAIYIGDLRKSRGLHAMLKAAALAPEWHFDFVGGISSGEASYVESWFQSHPEVRTRVKFHGRLPLTQAWKCASGAWVGLSLLEPTPAFIEAVPSKLYEYMTVGVATISTSLPRSKSLIESSGCGALADTPAQVAELLNRWGSPAGATELDRLRQSATAWAANNLDSKAEYEALAHQLRQLLA
jgi:glycosyltransferase involved in cell wall biosynthesis